MDTTDGFAAPVPPFSLALAEAIWLNREGWEWKTEELFVTEPAYHFVQAAVGCISASWWNKPAVGWTYFKHAGNDRGIAYASAMTKAATIAAMKGE